MKVIVFSAGWERLDIAYKQQTNCEMLIKFHQAKIIISENFNKNNLLKLAEMLKMLESGALSRILSALNIRFESSLELSSLPFEI